MTATYRPYSHWIRTSVAVTALFLLLPVLVIIYYAVQDNVYFELWPKEFGFRWFVAAAQNERFVEAAVRSLIVAVTVTPVTLALALPTAYAVVRYDFPLRGLVNAIIMSPLLVPGVVSGIAFLTLFGNLGVHSGMVRTVLAMICFSFPFAVRAIAANLQGIGPGWEEAALSLGASRTFVWTRVMLPLLRPGLLAGGIFVFVEAIDNFSIVVFLVTRESSTLPVEVYGYIKDFDDPSVAVVAVVSILFSTLLMFVVQRLVGLEKLIRFS